MINPTGSTEPSSQQSCLSAETESGSLADKTLPMTDRKRSIEVASSESKVYITGNQEVEPFGRVPTHFSIPLTNSRAANAH